MRVSLLAALAVVPVAFGPVLAVAPKAAGKAAPAARTAWTRVVARTADGGYRMGNPNAPVKLVEFGSRTCPTCARFAVEGYEALTSRYVATGKVSYEFHDFPVHGAVDLAPILLGRCVSDDRYFTLLDAMFANQQQLLTTDREISAADKAMLEKATPNQVAAFLADYYGYAKFAADHGVAPARATACLADRAGIEAIAREADAARTKYKISGTPSFFVNGEKVAAASWADLEPILRAKGAR